MSLLPEAERAEPAGGEACRGAQRALPKVARGALEVPTPGDMGCAWFLLLWVLSQLSGNYEGEWNQGEGKLALEHREKRLHWGEGDPRWGQRSEAWSRDPGLREPAENLLWPRRRGAARGSQSPLVRPSLLS